MSRIPAFLDVILLVIATTIILLALTFLLVHVIPARIHPDVNIGHPAIEYSCEVPR